MATKTTTTLPAAVPAGVLARKTRTTTPTQSKNVHNFAAWKDALGTARSATGYDTTSSIYGSTDIEVLTTVRPILQDLLDLAGQEISAGPFHLVGSNKDVLSGDVYGNAQTALAQIDDLIKRKVAKQIAGQTYKSRRTI